MHYYETAGRWKESVYFLTSSFALVIKITTFASENWVNTQVSIHILDNGIIMKNVFGFLLG